MYDFLQIFLKNVINREIRLNYSSTQYDNTYQLRQMFHQLPIKSV